MSISYCGLNCFSCDFLKIGKCSGCKEKRNAGDVQSENVGSQKK